MLSLAYQSFLEKLVIWTLLDTGLKISKLCQLTSEHFNQIDNVIHFSESYSSTKNKLHLRIIPLSSRVINLFQQFFSINSSWPIGVRQTQIRYTFVSIAFNQGISIPQIQHILGRQNLLTTLRYFQF